MATCPVHKMPFDESYLMPFDESYLRDPHTLFDRMLEEGPVHRVSLINGVPAWYVTRYAEVAEALRDPRLVRAPEAAGPDYREQLIIERIPSANLVLADPPEHTRLRRFINLAFRRDRIEAMRPLIERWMSEMVDAVRDDDTVDLMDELIVPLPILAVCHIMGVPEEHHESFRNWSKELFTEHPERSAAAFGELYAWLNGVVATKRENPGEDLISRWATMPDEGGSKLRHDEMVGLALLLLLGGFHTTVAGIANAVLSLLKHPDKAAELRTDPGLIARAVEELSRRDGSVHTGFRRFAAEDLEIGGTRIAKGDTVILGIAAAGRDPLRFEDPDVMDFHREDNHHLAFGRGPHFCPGSELARTEIQVAVEHLFTRYPDLELAVAEEELVWAPSYFVRVMRSLPVRLGKRAGG
ncbi:cytochrome P450 [Saccharothrix sp.]|uniref:cytochrome P450 family protein n=1 Tax=Saccharothrix sp. TaxID=1873460 RepID=UPI002811E5C9|nr:cytochrome P450 [Saccharothrix sp.]